MWTNLLWLALGILAGATLTLAVTPASWRTFLERRSVIHGLILILVLCSGLLTLGSRALTGPVNGLAQENPAELALIVKSVNENRSALQTELTSLQTELEETRKLVANGESLTDSVNDNIRLLLLATGSQSVYGPGVTITIQEASNMMYYDIIDLVNELFLSGAEAVSLNGQRFTSRTQISETGKEQLRYDNQAKRYVTDMIYAITVNGTELSYPLQIRAIGDAATLEKGLDYPGGVLQSLTALYGIEAKILQSDVVQIPAAPAPIFHYAQQTDQ